MVIRAAMHPLGDGLLSSTHSDVCNTVRRGVIPDQIG